MKIYIDRNNRISLKDQIVLEFQNRIVTGILKEGDKLPSIREIAELSGVSQMTVVKAYELLEKENLINKVHGKGCFVKFSHVKNELLEKEEDKDDWRINIQDYIVRKGYVQRNRMNHQKSGLNFALAGLNKKFLPTKDILANFNKFAEEDLIDSEVAVEGYGMLIDRVVDHVRDKGIDAKKEQVLITGGSLLGINVVANTYIGPGDVVVVESPSFPGAIDIFKSRGAVVIEVAMTPTGLDTERLLMICEKYDVKALYTMPVFHNPTGITSSLEVMQEILVLSKEHNFLVIEDDCWGDLYYGKFDRPLKSLDVDGRVIYIVGFSKTLGSSYRLSAIISDEVLCRKLIISKSNLDSGTPLINQLMIALYLGSMEHKKHLIGVREQLKQRVNRIEMYINKIKPPYMKVNIPKGGLVLWITLPESFDCAHLYYKLISEDKISFLLGENCYSSSKGGNQLRLAYGYVDDNQLISGIDKIINGIIEIHNK